MIGHDGALSLLELLRQVTYHLVKGSPPDLETFGVRLLSHTLMGVPIGDLSRLGYGLLVVPQLGETNIALWWRSVIHILSLNALKCISISAHTRASFL